MPPAGGSGRGRTAEAGAPTYAREVNAPPSADPAPSAGRTPDATGRLEALASAPFRLLLAVGTVMQLGQWIQSVALAWVVYEITGSAVSLATLGFLSNIFTLLLSPFAGVVADRLGARRVLMFAALVQAGGAGVLAASEFADHATLAVLYAVAITFGVGQALNQPTRNILVYDAVGRDLLRNALALNAFTGNAMRIVGPTIGGLIVAAGGGGPAFAVQAALLGISVVLVWLLPIESRAAASGRSIWRDIDDGFRHVAGNPPVRLAIGVTGLTAALVYPYMGFLPIFVTRNLGGGAWEQGLILSAAGVGSLVGLWYVAGGRGGMTMMLWTGAAYMTGVTIFAQLSHFWVAMAVLITGGIAHSVFSTLNQALVQLNADEAHRSHTMGLYQMVFGITPFSTLLLGLLIERLGASTAVGAYAGLAALITAAFSVRSMLSDRRAAAAAPARE